MSRISPERKTAYYVGGAILGLGLLMFFSTFLIGVANMGSLSGASDMRLQGALAFGGMALMLVGGIVRTVGARGLAGSGMKLDPEQAREDLQPYARMAGGLLGDVVSEAKAGSATASPGPAIKVRCPKCRALSDESAKFCSACGAPL